jgi:hypothetical protein
VANFSHWNLEGVKNLHIACDNVRSLNFSALWRLERLYLEVGKWSIKQVNESLMHIPSNELLLINLKIDTFDIKQFFTQIIQDRSFVRKIPVLECLKGLKIEFQVQNLVFPLTAAMSLSDYLAAAPYFHVTVEGPKVVGTAYYTKLVLTGDWKVRIELVASMIRF